MQTLRMQLEGTPQNTLSGSIFPARNAVVSGVPIMLTLLFVKETRVT